MFIVWGTKVVRKNRGRRADFCRLCRDFRPYRLVEIASVGHLYYVPLGRRTTLGHEETCEGCDLTLATPPSEAPPIGSRDRLADVDALLDETNPGARDRWAGRLAMEAQIRSGTLPAGERAAATLESFLLADALLAKRGTAGAINFDLVSGLGCLGTIAGVVATIALAQSVFRASSDSAGGLALAVGVILGIVTLVLIGTDGRRHARRVVLPVLARALRPLRPSLEEIEADLQGLKARGCRLGKVLRAEEVADAITFAEQH